MLPHKEPLTTNTTRCAACSHRKPRTVKLVAIVSGILLGVIGCAAFLLVKFLLVQGANARENGDHWGDDPLEDGGAGPASRVTLRMPLYVGVLTMEPYLHSRAASCNRTWARDPLISRLEYFARLGPASHQRERGDGVSVVNLTDIEGDDFYHRAASFRMLEYMCEQHVEQFDWFVRAVDDSYIKAGELLALLSTLDKDQPHYLGHASLGENELSLQTSRGRYYCLGGPSVIFSRGAMLGLCPHIRECERKFNTATADVELGRCVYSVLDLQCRRSSQFRKRFYNSYERNAFKLVEEFITADSAISLHPLKTPWLMTTVHRHVSRRALSRLSQRLTWLRSRENTLAVTVMSENNSRVLEAKIEDLQPVRLTVVTSSHKEMNAGTCSPITNMTSSAVLELSEAIRVSNASFLYGNNLRCRHLVDGHFLRGSPGGSTRYVTTMTCHNVTGRDGSLLAKAYLRAPHRDLIIRRQREREVQPKLVVFLHAYFGDPKVMEFLIMWKNLLRDGHQANDLLVLFLVYSPRRHRHSALDMEFALSDLERWKGDNKLNLLTYTYNNSVSLSTMHSIAFRDMESRFRDAVVLLAQPHLNFDGVFLQKCRLFVRPGKHMYRPYAEQRLIYRHWAYNSPAPEAVTETLWSEDFSPVCIHTMDLQRSRKQTKTGRAKRKPLKVISSFDMNLQLDTL